MLGCLTLLAPAIAFAGGKPQAPQVPQVTVGAELKALRFDWEPAKRAGYYRILYKADAQSEYVALGQRIPATKTAARVPVSAHLLDWVNARYRVAACNRKGCRYSAELTVTDLANDTIGYFKSDPAVRAGNFGWAIDLSADGRTLVAASVEDVNGVIAAGAAYVFQRANGVWTQQARLLPPTLQPAAGANLDVSISGDGNSIAIGLPGEDIPNTDPEEFGDVGAVYIFERSAGTWTQTARIAPENFRTYGDSFGWQVDLDAAGRTLAVLRFHGAAGGLGTVVMYRKPAATWTEIVSFPTNAAGENCHYMAMSGDGTVVAKSCRTFAQLGVGIHELHLFSGVDWSTQTTIQVDAPPSYSPFGTVAIDHRGRTVVVQSWTGAQPKAVLYRLRAGIYQVEQQFFPGAWQVSDYPNSLLSDFASSLALSRDGNTVAIGDRKDNGVGTGILQPPVASGSDAVGAVHVYQRRDGEWTQRSLIKRNNPALTDSLFGHSVELGSNGKVLAVGHVGESSNATGIDGDQNDVSLTNSGAVWLY
jgi:hypothetical protein